MEYNKDDINNTENGFDEVSENNATDSDIVSSDNFFDDAFVEIKEEKEDKEDVRYDEIFDINRPKNRGFSITSMVLGIVSVLCCCLGWTGLIFGAAAIVFAIVSRKSLGYFDGMSIAGLVVGIFGVCFGVLMLVVMYGPIAEMLEEIVNDLENEIPSDV